MCRWINLLSAFFYDGGEKLEFTIRTHIRSKDDEGVNDYIESLERFILERDASNTDKLLLELDNINGIIAKDIEMVSNGDMFTEETKIIDGEEETVTVSKLKVLNDDKDSKIFDRVLALYGKVKDIKAVSEVVKSMLPKTESKDKAKKQKLDPTKNIYEQVIKG